VPNTPHLFERRADRLAGRLMARRDLLANALVPAGSRPPFTKQLSKPQALAWWGQHRFDDLGRQVLANMGPEDVLELDQALSQANEAAAWGGISDGDESQIQ